MGIIYNTRLSLNLAKNVAHTLEEYDQLPQVGIDDACGDVVISFRGILGCVCRLDSVEDAKEWIKTTSPTTIGKRVMSEWRAMKKEIDAGLVAEPKSRPKIELPDDLFARIEESNKRLAKMDEEHKQNRENRDYIGERLKKHFREIEVIPHWKIVRFEMRTGYAWDRNTVAREMFRNLNEWKDALIELFEEDIEGEYSIVEPLKLESL